MTDLRQANGRNRVVVFVRSYVTGIKRAGKSNEKQRDKDAHHLSVTAL